jgi:hypothetical protein
MDCLNAYVLTRLSLDDQGNVTSRNVGVTFSIHEAERHKARGIENEFEAFHIASNRNEDAATTDLVVAMREFCGMVRELQQDAELR